MCICISLYISFIIIIHIISTILHCLSSNHVSTTSILPVGRSAQENGLAIGVSQLDVDEVATGAT